MPITGIQMVRNDMTDTLLFINTEFSGNNAELYAEQTVSVNNCWVPWCDADYLFAVHHIEIIDQTSNKVLWYIWQHKDVDGDFVRCSNTGFTTPGTPLGDRYTVGTSVNIEISADGSIGLLPA
jgi:hypothetical protein